MLSRLLGREGGQLLRWGAKSTLTLGVNLALLTVWVDYLGVWPEVAIFINWATIPVVGYIITEWWVFRDAPSADGFRGHLRRYVSMLGVNNAAKVGNYVIYVALVQVGIDYRVAWVFGAIAVFFLSFGGNRAVWTRGVGG